MERCQQFQILSTQDSINTPDSKKSHETPLKWYNITWKRLYYIGDESGNDGEDFKAYYNNNGQPIFNPLIMTEAPSFSIPDFQERSTKYRGDLGIHFRTRNPDRQLYRNASPPLNIRDESGKVLYCSFYNYTSVYFETIVIVNNIVRTARIQHILESKELVPILLFRKTRRYFTPLKN